MTRDLAFQQRIARIEQLVAEIEAVAEPASRAAMKELVAAVMELNAAGFDCVLQAAGRFGEAGPRLIESLLRDPAFSSLLVLYGLHPHSFETRVRDALKALDGVTIVSLQEANVSLRLERAAQEPAVRDAIYLAAPDLAELKIEAPGQTGFVPLSALTAQSAVTRP